MNDQNIRLQELTERAYRILRNLNIEVKDNVKVEWSKTVQTKTLGTYYNRSNSITISRLFHVLPDNEVMATLLHELLHSVDGCQNHGTKWKALAHTVNRAYGCNIKRTSDLMRRYGDKLYDEGFFTHKIYCSACNSTQYYTREPKVKDNLGSCYCGTCRKHDTLVYEKRGR